MDTWAARRKTIYLSLAFLILLIFIAVPLFLFLYRAPTCFDGKQNGDEVGVDCGGKCQLLCSFEALDPTVLWSRSFKVTGGIYSAVAYIENPNINSETLAQYVFKFYDANNNQIAFRENWVYIPKNKVIAVFEPNIDMQANVPARVTFEFLKKPEWRKSMETQPELVVTQNILSSENTKPRVDATVQNRSLAAVEMIELIAIVYDEQGNAIGASRTFVDRLEKDGSAQVTFTWPAPFTSSQIGSSASVVEVIPRVIPSQW